MPGPFVPTTDASDTLYVTGMGSTRSLADWFTSFKEVQAHSNVSTITNSTSATTLATAVIPSGAVGANGNIQIEAMWSYSSSANNKTLLAQVNGTAVDSVITTTSTRYRQLINIGNRNNLSSQIISAAAPNTAGASSFATTAIAMANSPVSVALIATCATSVDSVVLEYYEICTVRGA